MLRLALVCCGLFGNTPTDSTRADPPPASYEEARARFGSGSAGQVRLALWCEEHGLTAERLRHLARSVLTDPANVNARGLLGLVDDGKGRWVAPDEAAARAKEREGAALAEYNGRRERTPANADAQWKLALWCEQAGLAPEATAHLTAVTRLDPSRTAAWTRLGYVRHEGRWVPAEEAAAAKAEARAQADANGRWRTRLDRLKGYLGFKNAGRRDSAFDDLMAVTDPRAVPAVVSVFGRGDENAQSLAVRLLGGIEAPSSSRALADIAVFAESPAVRKAAAETLRRRDPKEFLDRLIARLNDPVKFDVKPVGGPGNMGTLTVEGDQFNVHRVYGVRAGLPNAQGPEAEKMQDELNTAAYSSRAQQADDVQALRGQSAAALKANDPVVLTLVGVLGWSAGPGRSDWDAWWNDQRGYVLAPRPGVNKPTISETIAPEHTPQPIGRYRFNPGSGYYIPNTDCFAAGTPVRTLDGPRAIESVKVGDRVLAQDPATGGLSFQPVVALFPTPQSETLRVTLDNETVVTTAIQRFWLARKGWVMARDLKPGDEVRTLGGLSKVAAVAADERRPVYNLEVARGHDYFAGTAGLLVHDHTVTEPVAQPFDAAGR